jgi:GT2 family glycosyltransferase
MASPSDQELGKARPELISALTLHRWEEALRLYEGEAWWSHDADQWALLGWIYSQLGLPTEAVAAYRRGLHLQPSNEACTARLIDLFLEHQLPYSALQVLENAVKVPSLQLGYQARYERLRAEHSVERVSVFSPGYGCEAVIERSLLSLKAQTYPVHEILLVDDRSPDRSTEIALRQGVRVFYHAENLGLAASCNTALEQCTGRFLAKVDSDVELEPTWLERTMQEFRNDNAAGVGGRLIEHHTATIPDQWRRTFLSQHWGSSLLVNADCLYGANCIFRVDNLKKVGGWNPFFRKNFEDWDLSQRLRQGGYNLIYQPFALAHHLRRDRLDEVLDTSYNYGHHAQFLEGPTYHSTSAIGSLIPPSAGLAVQRFQKCMQEERPELTYPCFLQFYWWCFRDLRQVKQRGIAPAEAVDQTLVGVFLILRQQLRNCGRIPARVVARTLQDLEVRVRTLIGEGEWTIFDADKTPDGLVLSAVQTAAELLRVLERGLPKADVTYLRGFVDENYPSKLPPGAGVCLDVSVRILAEHERDYGELSLQKPGFVLFNPPGRQRCTGTVCPESALRWFSLCAIENFACRLRNENSRVFVLDAVASALDEEEAHERVLGMDPRAVIYFASQSGFDRILGSARRLKFARPSLYLILLEAGELAQLSEHRFPIFDEIHSGFPQEDLIQGWMASHGAVRPFG